MKANIAQTALEGKNGLMRARNYAAQAERYLCLVAMGDHVVSNNYTTAELENLSLLASAIKSSVHYSLPGSGHLLDSNCKSLVGLPVYLPFKQVTIEFDTSEKVPGLIYADQREESIQICALFRDVHGNWNCLPQIARVSNVIDLHHMACIEEFLGVRVFNVLLLP